MLRRCLGLLVAVGLAATAASADAPRIYKWVDSNGIAHYTTDPDRIPKSLRNRIESLDRTEPEPTPSFERPAAAFPSEPDENEPAIEAREPESPPEGATTATPAPAVSPPEAARTVPSERSPSEIAVPSARTSAGEAWATRDALPRGRGSSVLAEGAASPAGRAALAEEREALDARIAEVEAAIARDEGVLKDLITDPRLDEETPLFDRPEFLEVSRRLPELQAELADLREQREQLGTP